jgi:hypothetical protein
VARTELEWWKGRQPAVSRKSEREERDRMKERFYLINGKLAYTSERLNWDVEGDYLTHHFFDFLEMMKSYDLVELIPNDNPPVLLPKGTLWLSYLGGD